MTLGSQSIWLDGAISLSNRVELGLFFFVLGTDQTRRWILRMHLFGLELQIGCGRAAT